MNNVRHTSLFLLCAMLFRASISVAEAGGILSENIFIESEVLGYNLQYRVYSPEVGTPTGKFPTLYVTDGQWHIEANLTDLLDKEIREGRIQPVIVVFIDNRNPSNLDENRRNQQFFCNKDYVEFFTSELLPTISKKYPVSTQRENRVIQGVSFGAHNSACFGLLASDKFGGISMMSPANREHVKELQQLYRTSAVRPVKAFLSFGLQSDNDDEGRVLRDILIAKGYEMEYQEVNYGHGWDNWESLFDESLQWFFSPVERPSE